MRTIACSAAALILQLKRSELFNGLNASTLELIASDASLFEYNRQEVLIEENSPATEFFVLVRGKTKIVHGLGDGRERLVHVVTSGGTIGEAAMFRQKTHPATVIAQQLCLCVRVNRETLHEAVRRDSELALRLLGVLSIRQRMFTKKLSSQGVGAVSRIARYIDHRAGMEDKLSFTLTVSREEMANMLGIARETLSRTLSRMVHDGVLAVSGRNITVLDHKRLQQLALRG